MRKTLFLSFFLSLTLSFSQSNSYYVQADYFYGNLIQQSTDAAILFQVHLT